MIKSHQLMKPFSLQGKEHHHQDVCFQLSKEKINPKSWSYKVSSKSVPVHVILQSSQINSKQHNNIVFLLHLLHHRLLVFSSKFIVILFIRHVITPSIRTGLRRSRFCSLFSSARLPRVAWSTCALHVQLRRENSPPPTWQSAPICWRWHSHSCCPPLYNFLYSHH